MSESETVLRVGDTMHWSLELLQQAVSEAAANTGPEGGVTLAVRVTKIEHGLDGAKVVSMERA